MKLHKSNRIRCFKQLHKAHYSVVSNHELMLWRRREGGRRRHQLERFLFGTPTRKVSICDDFNIYEVSNTRFKLDYLASIFQDASTFVEIEPEDISSKITY